MVGAATIRSTTLGVSVGTALSVQPSLGVFNEEAFAAIDWAVWAAKSCVSCSAWDLPARLTVRAAQVRLATPHSSHRPVRLLSVSCLLLAPN